MTPQLTFVHKSKSISHYRECLSEKYKCFLSPVYMDSLIKTNHMWFEVSRLFTRSTPRSGF